MAHHYEEGIQSGPSLRKGGPGNRRWVTSHSRSVSIPYRCSLDEIIAYLTQAKSEFVPGTAQCHYEQYTNLLSTGSIRVIGDRYATQQEVRKHNDEKNAKRLKELEAKRDRINAALDVIRKEAPGILGPEWTAEEILEEQAV